MIAVGWAWAEYLHYPIIKHIWTSSMVLWAAGWSYLLLALFYLVIDVIGLRFLAFPLERRALNIGLGCRQAASGICDGRVCRLDPRFRSLFRI